MLGDVLGELTEKAVDALEHVGADYAICGGVAVALAGRGRTTRDLDIVAVMSDSQLAAFIETAREAGFAHHNRADRHRLDEVVLYRFWLPVRDTGLSTSLDLQCGNSEFHATVARRALKVTVAGKPLRVATPEDLILMKLSAFRPIDRADAIDLLNLHRERLDLPYLDCWSEKLGLLGRLHEIREAR